MSTPARKIDGYAIQNTAHVLCALRAYEVKARSSGPGDATAAAIDCYMALSHRRVTGRTVRRWLDVVEGYGGIGKVPENAFGARKACPHFRRPVRSKLRDIAAQAELLAAKSKKGQLFDSRQAIELARIDRAMGDHASLVGNDVLHHHLISIRQIARRLGNLPIYQLHRFVSPAELEDALADTLVRLKTLTAQCSGKRT